MDRPYSKLEKLKEYSVFLATPTRKDKAMNIETAVYCSYVASHPSVQWGYASTVSPEMSRNMLIEDHNHFTGDKWTNVFFVDDDVVPPLDCLEKLLRLDADVCTGIYPLFLHKGFCWSVAEGHDDDWRLMNWPLPKEPWEVRSTGAGCLLVRREVLEEIGWPYFKMIYQPKWENGGESIKCGEDMYFGGKVRKAGYKIIADPTIICKHFNNIDMTKAVEVIRKQFDNRANCPRSEAGDGA